ncbi:hypothetical protein OIU84_013731 [Salix udensis]|uniref:NAD-dependent epimerase/dehydratase domain-containing protein n=1 Tax=Salix udensis TaxID=889485 RepID=A0AAD6NUT4_9ROSI|nr:hypothetical protein OIU84_013731 [Salix udensis]
MFHSRHGIFSVNSLHNPFKKEGWVVTGTCTSKTKKKQLEEKGFHVYLLDANQPELSTLNAMKCYTHLLVTIPPVGGVGDPMLQHGELLRSTLLDGNLQWLCYLSSTGVYGHYGGAWVDEDYPTSPTSELAKLRLDAEEGWLNLGQGLGFSTQVFRLGGIYGPGRSAVDTIIKQDPPVRSIYTPSSRGIYNIVDDDPAPREEVFTYAEDLIKKKWPGRTKCSSNSASAASPTKKDDSRGDKRVSNMRMKRELGVRLLHPSYRSGLLSIIDQMENPFHCSP